MSFTDNTDNIDKLYTHEVWTINFEKIYKQYEFKQIVCDYHLVDVNVKVNIRWISYQKYIFDCINI